jgi:four helix bundle protein
MTSDNPFEIKRRCYQFSRDLLKFIADTNYERIHLSIFDQLLRSGASIGANVVEGRCWEYKKGCH